MRKISRYNDPKNYTHRFFDNGVSEEKTPIAVYAMREKEVVSQNIKPNEWTPWQDLFRELDALDLAIIEEVARSRYLSSLLIYQLVSLRGFTTNRKMIKRHLKKLRDKRILMQLEIREPGSTFKQLCYELEYKGHEIAVAKRVDFHSGNQFVGSERRRRENRYPTAEEIKRILVGNTIVTNMLYNGCSMKRFGILETMRPNQELPITNNCILRTAANVLLDDESQLLYEVVRSAPGALQKLADKVERYYALINSETYLKTNYYGYKAIPQLVICGENYEHNLEIDRYLRSHGLHSEQDSLLYTEDLLHMKKTLTNLYVLDEKGKQSWYRLPGGEPQQKETGRTA